MFLRSVRSLALPDNLFPQLLTGEGRQHTRPAKLNNSGRSLPCTRPGPSNRISRLLFRRQVTIGTFFLRANQKKAPPWVEINLVISGILENNHFRL